MAAWKTRDTHRIREQKLLMGNGRSSHEHKKQNMRQKPHAKPSIFAGRQVAAVTHSMHAVCAGPSYKKRDKCHVNRLYAGLRQSENLLPLSPGIVLPHASGSARFRRHRRPVARMLE